MPLPLRRQHLWIAPGRMPSEANDIVFPGEWTDVSDWLRYESGTTVTVGRKDESDRTEPTKLAFQLVNQDGRFSPGNAEGPYWPGLDRNTPLLVTWDADGLGDHVPMFGGYVTEWKPIRDHSRNAAFTRVTAHGVLRRWKQNDPAIRSAIRREISSPSRLPQMQAYWPCEDNRGATELASAIEGVEPMRIQGSAQLAANDDIPASSPLPTMNGARFTGPMPAYEQDPLGGFLIRVMYVFPSDGAENGTQILGFPSTSSAARWAVFYETGGVLRLRVSEEGTGATIEDSAFAFGVDGQRISFSLEVTENGLNLDWKMLVVFLGQLSTTALEGTGSFAGNRGLGHVQNIVINFNRLGQDIAFGHVVFSTDTTVFANTDQALVGWAGELAGDRLLRLAEEEGVLLFLFGLPGDEVPMGPQQPSTLLSLILECVDADGGVLSESINGFGLEYRNKGELYLQDPLIALDPEAGEIAAPPEPDWSDRGIANTVTVERQGGSSATATDDEHIDRVGLYETTLNLNVATDGLLPDLAGWEVHLGTVEGARYPVLTLNLARPGNEHLIDVWLAARATLARRLTATYVTPQEPNIGIDVLIQGWTETLTLDNWIIELHCTPAAPWDVAELADDLESPIVSGNGRLDTATSVLNEGIVTATTFDVAAGDEPEWVIDSDHWPFDILVGGERMTVTNVAGSSSPQTFTVIRGVNDVHKTHLQGTPVRVVEPFVVVT